MCDIAFKKVFIYLIKSLYNLSKKKPAHGAGSVFQTKNVLVYSAT